MKIKKVMSIVAIMLAACFMTGVAETGSYEVMADDSEDAEWEAYFSMLNDEERKPVGNTGYYENLVPYTDPELFVSSEVTHDELYGDDLNGDGKIPELECKIIHQYDQDVLRFYFKPIEGQKYGLIFLGDGESQLVEDDWSAWFNYRRDSRFYFDKDGYLFVDAYNIDYDDIDSFQAVLIVYEATIDEEGESVLVIDNSTGHDLPVRSKMWGGTFYLPERK